MKNSMIGKYVIVATATRPWSIVAGTLVRRTRTTATLANARMIVYFTADSRSVVGAATRGVSGEARVSPPCDEGTFGPIEMILVCSDVARASIEAEPWQ